MRRFLVLVVVPVLTVAGLISATPAAASAGPTGPTVAITGAVTTPASYTYAQLAALPQHTVADQRFGHGSHSVIGVSLADLVNSSSPVLPAGVKNGSLRVVVTVDGLGPFDVAVALGELDPGFGNHPAYLALSEDGRKLLTGPDLVFPGDNGLARTVLHVTKISVAVVSPGVAAVAPGSIQVVNGSHVRTLTAADLARLPKTTRTVTFLSGTTPQTNTETGPTLATVLLVAGVWPWLNTSVAAVGGDGYVATVTPAEATLGGRPLLISTVENGVALDQPRLVVDGDIKGGRYVSGVVELVVGN